jgi:uncharacterized membrane protein
MGTRARAMERVQRLPTRRISKMRLQELHPSLVHFPIAILPASLAIDAVGRAADDDSLMRAGRLGIVASAAGALVAGIAGLIAQEGSRFDEESHEILVTHRNLNLAVIGLTAWMARRRLRTDRPSLRYLAAGLAGIGVMSYSAYLGGHMVYEMGVGVKRAGGIVPARAPLVEPGRAGEVARVAASNVAEGVRHTLEDLVRGEVVPRLTVPAPSPPPAEPIPGTASPRN